MKLKVLDLEHWCQHTSLHIEFPDTAIVRISGPNNVGKSNLIKAIGRVLAQGRSDFGDAADIQYGAKQATLRLQAETSEGSPFTIGRVVREKQSKVSLEFDGLPAPIASAEEVEAKLTEWFGRLDTLLSLFIAPQGRIASLLKTGGKQRLVDFIEICGFKSFILKQSSLNKFIKAYPVILDPSMTLADIQAKAQSAKEQASEKQAAIAALPLLAMAKAELDGLQAEKALRAQQKTDLAAKQQELQGKEQLAAKSLPDLKQLEQSTLQQQANARQHKICLQVPEPPEGAGAARGRRSATQRHSGGHDRLRRPDQKISDSLQNDLRTKSSFEQTEQELQTKQDELRELNGKVAACHQTVQGLRYGRGWHAHSIAELQKGLTLLAQRNAHTEAIASTTKKVEELRAVPIPTPEILKACQATEREAARAAAAPGPCQGCPRQLPTMQAGMGPDCDRRSYPRTGRASQGAEGAGWKGVRRTKGLPGMGPSPERMPRRTGAAGVEDQGSGTAAGPVGAAACCLECSGKGDRYASDHHRGVLGRSMTRSTLRQPKPRQPPRPWNNCRSWCKAGSRRRSK